MSGKLIPAAWMATRTCPGASGAASNVSSRRRSGGPSSRQTTAFGIRPRSLLAARQGLADQRQAVIAEIHVGLVDEDRRRAEAAARHHLIGVGLELVLDRLLADARKEFLRIDADASCRSRPAPRPARCPCRRPNRSRTPRGRTAPCSFAQPDAAAHRLHAVHRKHRRRHLDREPRRTRPVRRSFFM